MSQETRSPERAVLLWIGVVFALNLAGVLLFAVRADSSSDIRLIVDALLAVSMCGALTVLALKALYAYPFRTLDLLLIVLLTAWGIKLTLEAADLLAQIGVSLFDLVGVPYHLPVFEHETSSQGGPALGACLLTVSLMFAGAALGLRHCHILKIDRPFTRALCLASGVVALPAAAGIAAFAAAILRIMLDKKGPDPSEALRLVSLWLVSILVTSINAVCAIKSLTLQAEVRAQESAWKKK